MGGAPTLEAGGECALGEQVLRKGPEEEKDSERLGLSFSTENTFYIEYVLITVSLPTLPEPPGLPTSLLFSLLKTSRQIKR